MVFSYLVWGGTRRYGGVGRKSPIYIVGAKWPSPFWKTQQKSLCKKKNTRAGWNKRNHRAIRISKVVKDKANLIWKGRKLQLQGGEFIERERETCRFNLNGHA